MTLFDSEELHNEQRMGAKTCFSFLMIHDGSGSSEQHLEGTTAKRLVISLLVIGEKWLSCVSWECELKHFHGTGNKNGNDFRGAGNVEKYMVQKFQFHIRHIRSIVLVAYLALLNAPEIEVRGLLP